MMKDTKIRLDDASVSKNMSVDEPRLRISPSEKVMEMAARLKISSTALGKLWGKDSSTVRGYKRGRNVPGECVYLFAQEVRVRGVEVSMEWFYNDDPWPAIGGAFGEPKTVLAMVEELRADVDRHSGYFAQMRVGIGSDLMVGAGR